VARGWPPVAPLLVCIVGLLEHARPPSFQETWPGCVSRASHGLTLDPPLLPPSLSIRDSLWFGLVLQSPGRPESSQGLKHQKGGKCACMKMHLSALTMWDGPYRFQRGIYF